MSDKAAKIHKDKDAHSERNFSRVRSTVKEKRHALNDHPVLFWTEAPK